MEEMAELLKKVKVESERLGLRLNVSKTKIMSIGTDGEGKPLIIDDNEVESVTQFNFLGSLITKEGGCSQ
jgi:meiotically up-regulated gene 157 (Mug157) protein